MLQVSEDKYFNVFVSSAVTDVQWSEDVGGVIFGSQDSAGKIPFYMMYWAGRPIISISQTLREELH